MLHVLGRSLEYTGSTQAVVAFLHDNWNFPESASALESTWRVYLSEEPQAPPRAVVDAPHDVGIFDTRHVHARPDEFWILQGESGVRVQVGLQAAKVDMYGDPFTAWLALHGGISGALGASGLIHMHAAAIGKDGQTVVLLGPSGRGKSTTMVRAVGFGWRPMAEDGCWLEPVSLRLFGMDRSLRLLPDALDVLHSVAPGLDPVPGTDGKYTIPFADLGGRLDDRLLTDLVLLERRPGAPSAWEPLSQTEAVMALYEAAGVPHTANHRAFAAAAFGDIVGRTTLARLRLGDTELPL